MEYRQLGKTGLRISRMGFGGIPIQRIDAEGTKELMHKLMEALSTEGIPVLQTADSNVTIWCLVHAEHMNRAVQTLHRKFQLEHYF